LTIISEVISRSCDIIQFAREYRSRGTISTPQTVSPLTVGRCTFNSLVNSLTDQHRSYSQSQPPFPFFPSVYIVLVASSVVLFSIIRKHQKQLSSALRFASSSRGTTVQQLGLKCIVFDDWFNTETHTQMDGQTDRHAQTNRRTDGQEFVLCFVSKASSPRSPWRTHFRHRSPWSI
jgi:hypothetical protein